MNSVSGLSKEQQIAYARMGVQLLIMKLMMRTDLTEDEIIRAVVWAARQRIGDRE